MLVEAYCFEINAREQAEDAYLRSRNARMDHWYCPCPTCLIPVRPKRSKLGRYFFAGQKRLHLPNCPHYVPPTTGPGGGHPQPHPPVPLPPVYPTVLGTAQPPHRVPFRQPTRQQLIQLIATSQPAPRGGSLEEVVNAWGAMTPAERAAHPLEVGENATTYEHAFVALTGGQTIPPAIQWDQHVFHFDVVNNPGNATGYYFVDSANTYSDNGIIARTHIMLNTPVHASVHKRYINQMLSTQRQFKLFWHGPRPNLQTSANGANKLYLLQYGQRPGIDQIALR